MSRHLQNVMEPAQGSIWIHGKSGRMYWVVCLAYMEADESPVVVYRRVDAIDRKGIPDVTNNYWVRPLPEFLEKFTERR